MTAQFAHLHVHTEYSTLDGAARVRDLVAEAARQEAPAVAITDHGQLHGAYDFFHQAKGAGVTPIIGIEAYVAPGSRRSTDRVQWGMPEQRRDDVSGGGSYTHMTMWARNRDGLHNLYRLSSTAYANGMLHKPRMDRELLAEHSDGLMATTGCPSGEVSTRIRLGQMDEALKAAGEYQDIFGRENFYVELMDHGIDIDRRARAGLEELARKIGAPFVVTNDSHYTYEHESAAHDTLLCVQTGAQRADEKRFRFDGSGYYLKSAAEMYAIDASDDWQEGCRNTLAIAERIDTEGMFEPRNL
ncbi:PHP domain-containing protein, partial [Pseudactinotalea sp.]|uniref:PHP domain-containing protein n=1 Tax=Pseudactinotalea sp. TaxID=1926260 RepID=UPI003B3A80DC